MRTELKTIYKVEDMDAEQFKRAHRKWNERTMDIPWMDETIDSLKAIFETCDGVSLKDWSIGAYHQGCYVKFEFSQDGVEDLTGPRAMAWLENNLFCKLRAPWGLKAPALTEKRYVNGTHNSVYNTDEDGRPMRRWTAPGYIKSCPLTGYAMDEDLIDALRDNIKSGMTLRDSFADLADVARKQLESEDEYQRTADYFRETCDANGYEFDEDGDLV